MERVTTLLQKLQKQLDDNATAEAMLQTVHILQAELLNKVEKKTFSAHDKVSVVMPVMIDLTIKTTTQENGEEKSGRSFTDRRKGHRRGTGANEKRC